MSEPEDTHTALAGIRVLDLGLLVQAPQAAQLLGDFGADVIKVELPGLGDQARWIPVSLEDLRGPFFVGCNRGKRSMTIDLRLESGKEAFLKLVETADVVLSNFVPGTLERWGIGYETLSKHNPRIILGCGSTFGLSDETPSAKEPTLQARPPADSSMPPAQAPKTCFRLASPLPTTSARKTSPTVYSQHCFLASAPGGAKK